MAIKISRNTCRKLIIKMASYSGFSEKQKGGRKMSLEWMHVLIEKNNEKTITKYTDSNSSHSTSVATSTKVNEIKPLEISTFNTVKNRSDDSLPKKLKRKGTLNDFIIPTTKQQKNQFDEALAEFFYASNLAFEKVEHPSFLRFLNLLRPGYNPPNRKELSGPLLDIVSKKIDLMMTSELMQDDRPITLLQDGWSSVKNDPIIATSIHTANYMDPKYFGKDLSNNEEKEAEELILKYYPEYVDDILSFKIKDIDKYPSNMFSDQVISTMSSHKWWIILANKCDKIDNSNGPKKEFCIFMANLFSCPVSSAATERIFSTYAHVWSKLRNSLAPQKIDKLVKIYRYQNK
ncbi:uncharacterized protein LOC113003598 isoform X3 [Solenopsis invicta]|uniref:uncharacterized protein LOC113003598 isoform X3 n=2 Tax=Solenopsis invicta TaxID=13686 RepID=UPI00193E6020|nr:uncharacterized protein LOC113003598 isoform X3 [Solenopsis invicta]